MPAPTPMLHEMLTYINVYICEVGIPPSFS